MFDDIVENIQKKQNEETTSANIAYLPGGFGRVGDALKKLAKKKKEWHVEYIPDDQNTNMVFENELVIQVPTNEWADFIEEAFGSGILTYTSDTGVMLHAGAINESAQLMERHVEKKARLIRGYTARVHPVRESRYNMLQFQKTFGTRVKALKVDAMIHNVNDSVMVKSFVNKIKSKNLHLDPGFLQVMEADLLSRNSLKQIHEILGGKNVMQGKVSTSYNGVTLIFETTVLPDYKVSEVLYVWDDEVCEAARAMSQLRVVNNAIVPRRGFFASTFFRFIREVIDHIDEEK